MVIFNLQLKGSLDARQRQGERDEGGFGGRLALRRKGGGGGGATLAMLSKPSRIDADYKREQIWHRFFTLRFKQRSGNGLESHRECAF